MDGFSLAFDLISSEYGWRDDELWELTLHRMQQIVAAITIRKSNDAREHKRELSWAVRTISSFIAAGYMSEDNKGVEAAQDLTIDDIERKIIDANLPTPPPEIRTGSTEALLRAFGGRPT